MSRRPHGMKTRSKPQTADSSKPRTTDDHLRNTACDSVTRPDGNGLHGVFTVFGDFTDLVRDVAYELMRPYPKPAEQ